jgi:hypothetical protein
MSDPIAEAAANLDAAPSSTEPVTGNVLVNETPVVAAPVVEAGTATAGEIVAAPVEAAPVDTSATTSAAAVESVATQDADELPRESHLMLLEAKIAGFRAKLANAERVALDEFEAIVAHVRAVL